MSDSIQDTQIVNIRLHIMKRWYFLVADLDGNNNQMIASYKQNQTGPTINIPLGIRNASLIDRIAMAGTTGLNGQYLKDFGWSNKGFIANFHHYPNSFINQNTQNEYQNGEFKVYDKLQVNAFGGQGISPEADNLRNKLKWLRGGIGEGYGEYWLSEIGWDSWPAGEVDYSGVEALAIPVNQGEGPYDSEKVQAQWLTRTILESAWSKSIDKVMLYELEDEPTQGAFSYAHSRVLDASGKNKRAWYYLMTLKKTIGDYVFEQEIIDGSNDFMVSPSNKSADDVRVYMFRNPNLPAVLNGKFNYDARILVVWSPTAMAKPKFTTTVTFPPSFPPFDPQQSLATKIDIQELSEIGRYSNISQGLSGKKVTIEGTHETPLFVKFGQGKDSKIPNHVQSFACGNSQNCCGSIELGWINPVGQLNLNTLIYYIESTSGAPCPTFDPVKAQLYANNSGPGRSRITISGLTPGKTYCFYAVPVGVSGTVPENLASTLSCQITISQGDYLSIASFTSHLTGVTVTPGQSSGLTNLVNDACSLSNACDGKNNFEWVNPAVTGNTSQNTIQVSFTEPHYVGTIIVASTVGAGVLNMQILDCCTNTWQNTAGIPIRSTGRASTDPCNLNTISFGQVVKGIRFSQNDPAIGINAIRMCGRPSQCPNISEQRSEYPEIAEELNVFEATDIDEHSSLLEWSSFFQDEMLPEQGFVPQYQLSVSQLMDDSGNLIDENNVSVQGEAFAPAQYYRLEGLAPNTTYHAKIEVDPYASTPSPGTKLCDYQKQSDPRSVTFTTKGSGAIERADFKPANSVHSFKVFMTPSPTSGQFQLEISQGQIAEVTIVNPTGKVISKRASVNSSTAQFDLQHVPAGYYWAKVTNANGVTKTVGFVKI
jgi:Secretion system C-terminal sorting domain